MKKIGTTFRDRNWLAITRLLRAGFDKEKAEELVKRCEETGESLREIIAKEKQSAGK